MSEIKLTLERTKELLAEAVALKGAGYIYTHPDGWVAADGDNPASCRYVHDDQPGCIVGHVLHAAGVSLEALSEYEGQGAQDPAYQLAGATDGAARLLDFAQDHQDRGVPWGEAVRQAQELLAG